MLVMNCFMYLHSTYNANISQFYGSFLSFRKIQLNCIKFLVEFLIHWLCCVVFSVSYRFFLNLSLILYVKLRSISKVPSSPAASLRKIVLSITITRTQWVFRYSPGIFRGGVYLQKIKFQPGRLKVSYVKQLEWSWRNLNIHKKMGLWEKT